MDTGSAAAMIVKRWKVVAVIVMATVGMYTAIASLSRSDVQPQESPGIVSGDSYSEVGGSIPPQPRDEEEGDESTTMSDMATTTAFSFTSPEAGQQTSTVAMTTPKPVEAGAGVGERDTLPEAVPVAVRYGANASLTDGDRRRRPRLQQEQLEEWCSPEECQKPKTKCHCSKSAWPSGMRWGDVPQMVMLTFDDFVVTENMKFYRELGLLGGQGLINPNGCPYTATYFVSEVSGWPDDTGNTNYSLVRELHAAGHEIGSHGVSHKWPQTWWSRANLKQVTKEFGDQRERISRQAGIPLSDIVGVRSPFLEMAGSDLFQMLTDSGMLYDATAVTGAFDDGPVWPFRGDERFKFCYNRRCPRFGKFPKVWELPINEMMTPRRGKPCIMADNCYMGDFPRDKQGFLSFFWKNFSWNYLTNKAPMNLCLHSHVFNTDPDYQEALKEFLQELVTWDDVYVVSANQIIAWLQQPTSNERLATFAPWQRSCH